MGIFNSKARTYVLVYRDKPIRVGYVDISITDFSFLSLLFGIIITILLLQRSNCDYFKPCDRSSRPFHPSNNDPVPNTERH